MESIMSKREDGSWVRIPRPRMEASPQEFQAGVACRDVFIKHPEGEAGSGAGHELAGLWGARIHLPQTPTLSIDLHNLHDPDPKVAGRLPLILYFHGGGFVFASDADPIFHPFLQDIAKATQAIVIGVDYRLAPEHRLPAAYDDCLAAISWLQSQALTPHADATDPWLRRYADFSRCYLMGDSAGGNIVYHLSLKLASMKMEPLQIEGHVLIHPFFGGVANTKTEELMANDTVIPLKSLHWVWGEALPSGADRDHPFSNPMSVPASVYANAHLPKTLVAIAHGDPMIERQRQYCDILKQAGVDIHVHFEEGNHGCYVMGEGYVEKAACFIKDVVAPFLHARG